MIVRPNDDSGELTTPSGLRVRRPYEGGALEAES
jgi:hypothetical protein